MTEIFLLSLLTGGLAAMVEKAGGIDNLLKLIRSKINGKICFIRNRNLCRRNRCSNSKQHYFYCYYRKSVQKITEEYKIKPRVTASILDTFSCFVQGLFLMVHRYLSLRVIVKIPLVIRTC